ncbi:hypothetical protein TKK_0010579 [Trichogramma kaykai]
MEDLRTVINILEKGDYMCSIDLKDAYFLIPVCKESQKYLKFVWNDNVYQFLVLPFGLCTAPYIYTKILKPIITVIRKNGIRVSNYLDDFLIFGKSQGESISLLNNNELQNSKELERFFKGVYRLRPPAPKYSDTWDVTPVLTELKKWHPLESLSLEKISWKVTMLLALGTGFRAQSIALIKLDGIKEKKEGVEIRIQDLIKTSKLAARENTSKSIHLAFGSQKHFQIETARLRLAARSNINIPDVTTDKENSAKVANTVETIPHTSISSPPIRKSGLSRKNSSSQIFKDSRNLFSTFLKQYEAVSSDDNSSTNYNTNTASNTNENGNAFCGIDDQSPTNFIPSPAHSNQELGANLDDGATEGAISTETNNNASSGNIQCSAPTPTQSLPTAHARDGHSGKNQEKNNHKQLSSDLDEVDSENSSNNASEKQNGENDATLSELQSSDEELEHDEGIDDNEPYQFSSEDETLKIDLERDLDESHSYGYVQMYTPDAYIGYEWEMMKKKRITMFARKLANAIWSEKILSNRCLKHMRFEPQLPNRGPRKLVKPWLLELYFRIIRNILDTSLLYSHMDEKSKRNALLKCARTLSYHIRDLRRSALIEAGVIKPTKIKKNSKELSKQSTSRKQKKI